MSWPAWYGIVNVYKPAGVTSRDVVDEVQMLVGRAKAGHAGTLDPLATGVLLVALGPATRLIDALHRLPKAYLATFLLGRSSPTDDVDGEVTLVDGAPAPAPEALVEAVPQFVGRILQQPPVYSALKVRGRRACDRVRQGEAVELAPRPVEVYRLDIVDYAYPRLVLRIECGSGTYVRALGRDLARAVGTEAVMSALEREAIGPFRVEDAWPRERLTRDALATAVRPALLALPAAPQLTLSEAEWQRLARGQTIAAAALAADAVEAAALDAEGRLVAVLERRGAEWGPAMNLLAPPRAAPHDR